MISTQFTFVLVSTLLCAASVVSAISAGESCTSTPDGCDAPLSCVGNPTNKRCFMKKALGMRCGQDPFWVCEDGLACTDGTCTQTTREADSCNSPGIICPAPLSCVGNEGNKKCFMKKELGMKCGQDPFWVCVDGLTCLDGTCVKASKEAGVCDSPTEVCIPPLSCVGPAGTKRCFMKKGLGMVCGQDPFWVCEDGLTCLDGTCVKTSKEAGVCDSPNEVCIPPLSCVGPVGTKRCFMKKGLGMVCGQDPFWVCEDGLTCLDGTCVKTSKEAGVCDSPNEVCLPPLSCVGPEGTKRCFMKKGLGMVCGQDPFWVCEDGLTCIDGKCMTPVGRAGSCSDPGAGCVPPFICAGPSGSEKCVKRKYRGMPCGDSPFSKCAPRLKCDTDGICKREMGIRGKCGVNNQICPPELSCIGTPTLKRCVMKKGLSMVCGKDPFWVCQDDLECVNFRCV